MDFTAYRHSKVSRLICLLLLVLLYGLPSVHSQQLRTDMGEVYYEPNFYRTKYDAPQGSPYLKEVFSSAKIDGVEKTQLVRFDAVEGNVEVMVSEDQLVVLENSKKFVITLSEDPPRVYHTLGYLDNKGGVKHTFFELLAGNEHYRLYLKEAKKYFKKVKAQGYASEKPARFEKVRDVYYVSDFVDQTDELLPVPNKLKSFLALFGEDSPRIKAFIRAQKLKTDLPEDLIRIFDYHFSENP